MGEETHEHEHEGLARGGKLVALLSILFLVPAVRKLRALREEKRKPRRHFPLLGH